MNDTQGYNSRGGMNNGNNSRGGYRNNRYNNNNDSRPNNYRNNNRNNYNDRDNQNGGYRGGQGYNNRYNNRGGRDGNRSYQARKYTQHAEMFSQCANLPAQSNKPYENRKKQDEYITKQIGAATDYSELEKHMQNLDMNDNWKQDINRPESDNRLTTEDVSATKGTSFEDYCTKFHNIFYGKAISCVTIGSFLNILNFIVKFLCIV